MRLVSHAFIFNIYIMAVIGAAGSLQADSSDSSKQDVGNSNLRAKIKQLVRQLDDDDFFKRQEAEASLSKIGAAAAPELEVAARDGSPEVKMRALRCLVSIRKLRVIDGFIELSKAKEDTAIDIEKGMWLIAMTLDPTVEKKAIDQQLDQLAKEVRQQLGKDVDPVKADPMKVVDAMREVLATKHGFAGNLADYSNPANSSIASVLKTKKGLPILLSHVYVAVGDRLKVPLVGIGVPGQYMLKYEGSKAPAGFAKKDIIVDPHMGSRVLTPQQLAAFVGAGFDPDEHLAPSGHRPTLLRMMSNLQSHLLASGDNEKAQFVAQLQTVLSDSLELE